MTKFSDLAQYTSLPRIITFTPCIKDANHRNPDVELVVESNSDSIELSVLTGYIDFLLKKSPQLPSLLSSINKFNQAKYAQEKKEPDYFTTIHEPSGDDGSEPAVSLYQLEIPYLETALFVVSPYTSLSNFYLCSSLGNILLAENTLLPIYPNGMESELFPMPSTSRLTIELNKQNGKFKYSLSDSNTDAFGEYISFRELEQVMGDKLTDYEDNFFASLLAGKFAEGINLPTSFSVVNVATQDTAYHVYEITFDIPNIVFTVRSDKLHLVKKYIVQLYFAVYFILYR